MEAQIVDIDIIPREQFRPYLERSERWATLVAHRRAGKTVAVIQDLIHRALTHKRDGPPLRYGYIAPTRDQAKDITWGYLCDYVEDIPNVTINQAELRLTLPTMAQIRLYSGENFERMRGLYFDGVVSDEAADIDPKAFSYVIRPCLIDYKGWHTRIGTPKGKDSFYRAHKHSEKDPTHYSLLLKASESGILNDEELADIRADPEITEEVYAQEMECDFDVGRPGSIYAAAIKVARREGRVASMPVAGDSLVHTSWDLGAPQNTVVWYFQIVGREIRIIDCDRSFDGTLVERVAHMFDKGYSYGHHYLPHDAQQTDRTGRTVLAELGKLGLANLACVPRTHSIWVGINHLLQLMPAMQFRQTDEVEDGLEALGSYWKKEEREGVLSNDKPVHDWASHTADAMRTMAEAHLSGMFKFSHTPAEPDPERYGRKKRGMKPMRVS